ncbi:MAG: DUF4175 family protein [Candidatus Latescibacterota bacterium]|nr:DUF4175 family protein [Candidatus Latescibacterota bacterium]
MDPFQSILARLASLRRRALVLTLCTGFALALAAGSVLALVWVGLEALFFLSPPWRTGLGLMALLGAGAALALFLRRHLPTLLSPRRFALCVEHRCPQLGQRLISALELSTASSFHSPELLAAATRRASELLRAADPAQILDHRPLYIHLRLLGGATALVLVCGALFYGDLARAADRCRHPLTAYHRPPRTRIEIQPGDLEVVKGEDATLQIRFAGRKPRLARVMRRPTAESPWQSEELIVERADSIAHTFRQVQRPFRYAVTAGDGQSAEYQVRVIDPPAVERLRLHYQYPGYSRLPDRIEEESGDIQCLAGTLVDLEISANKSLAQAALILDDTLTISAALDGETARVSLEIRHPGQYHLDLTDRKGVHNRDPIRYAIQISEDLPPEITLVDPGRDMDLPESLKVLLKAEASDDFSVEEIVLVHHTNDGPEKRRTLKTTPGREVPLSHVWDLAAANLLPEDRVYYHLEVFDNDRISGPKKGQSRQYALRFPSLYELHEEANQAREEQLDELEELAAEGQEHREYLERVRRELLKSEELSWEQKKELESTLDRESERARALEELAAELQETIDSMEEKGTGADELLEKLERIRELMGDIATPELQRALAELQRAAENPDPQALAEALKQFNEDQQAFQERLDRTIALLEQVQTEQRLQAVVEQAAELARRQAQINDELAAGESGLRQQQQEGSLQRDTERLAQQLSELGESMQNPETAAQLAQQAEAMENGQLSGRMRQMVQEMRAKANTQAQRLGEGLEEDLGILAANLQDIQHEYTAGEKDQLSRELRRAMREVVQLSQRQEDLLEKSRDQPAEATLAEDQFALLQGAGQITERLANVGRRTLSLAQGLNTTLGYALRNMGEAAENLGQRDARRAQNPQAEAMRYLNETVLLLRESLDNLAQAQTPSGFGEAMQKMLGLSEQQAQLNQASQQALAQAQQRGPGRGGPQLQRQLGRLTAEQNRLVQALEELGRSLRGPRGAQQRVDAIQEEMRDVLAELSQRRLDHRTLQKQERIYQRMLDASRSLHSRGFKEKRQGKTAADQPYAGPAALPGDLGQTPDRWRQALRQALAGPYPDEYRALLKRYYDQIYQDVQLSEMGASHGDAAPREAP